MINKAIFTVFYALLLTATAISGQPTADKAWTLPVGETIRTLFYQGIFNSQTQCCRYTGPRGLDTTTGEHATCSKAIDLIHTPYIGVEIDEVHPQIPFDELWQHRQNPSNLVRAGYHYVQYPLARKRNKTYGVSITSPSLTGQSIVGHSTDLSRFNLGQTGDVHNHQQKYNSLVEEHGDSPFVVFGVSRGAATSFNAVALNGYTNISLAIFEGCFDSLTELIKERWPRLAALQAPTLVPRVLEGLTSYKASGIHPIDAVALYPKDVPTLFITSKKDGEVPAACTTRLAHALADAGHPEVYLLTLDNCSHTGYMVDDARDRDRYERVVHALYKKLGLPHRTNLAIQGKSELAACHIPSNPTRLSSRYTRSNR